MCMIDGSFGPGSADGLEEAGFQDRQNTTVGSAGYGSVHSDLGISRLDTLRRSEDDVMNFTEFTLLRGSPEKVFRRGPVRVGSNSSVAARRCRRPC